MSNSYVCSTVAEGLLRVCMISWIFQYCRNNGMFVIDWSHLGDISSFFVNNVNHNMSLSSARLKTAH